MRLRILTLAVIGILAQATANAQTITNLTLNPTTITGGNTSTGTVTLSSPAGSGGASVGLSSSNTGAATVPASVTVPQGQTSATFLATGVADWTTRTTTITATLNGTRTANLSVVAPTISGTGLSLSPSSVHGGDPVTGTVTLTGTAPPGGYPVYPASTNSLLVTVPTSFTIPAGVASGTFTILTTTINGTATVTIFAYDQAQHLTGAQPVNLTLTETYNDLRVTDYYLPATAHLAWNGTAAGNWLLYRNGTQIASLGSYTNSYDDTFGGGSPPAGEIDYDLYMSNYPGVIQSHLRTNLATITATENQAVDSRLDLRWSTLKYIDFQFADRIYRGGLFVGNNNDGSRVGRSFGKFTVGSMPSPFLYHTSNANAYSTGNYTTGTATATVNVGVQVIPDDTWVASTLKWTTQPAVNPASYTEQTTVSFNPSSPTHTWYHWPMMYEIIPEMLGDHVASLAWTSVDETSGGWAYFAKNQYNSTLGPRVTQVISYPKWMTLTASPTTAQHDSLVTVTVTLDGLGPGQSVTITNVDTNANYTIDGLNNRTLNFTTPHTGTSFTIHLRYNTDVDGYVSINLIP